MGSKYRRWTPCVTKMYQFDFHSIFLNQSNQILVPENQTLCPNTAMSLQVPIVAVSISDKYDVYYYKAVAIDVGQVNSHADYMWNLHDPIWSK